MALSNIQLVTINPRVFTVDHDGSAPSGATHIFFMLSPNAATIDDEYVTERGDIAYTLELPLSADTYSADEIPIVGQAFNDTGGTPQLDTDYKAVASYWDDNEGVAVGEPLVAVVNEESTATTPVGTTTVTAVDQRTTSNARITISYDDTDETGFKVRWTKDGGATGDWVDIGTALEYVIPSGTLDENSEYTAEAVAYNAEGDGDISAPVTFHTWPTAIINPDDFTHPNYLDGFFPAWFVVYRDLVVNSSSRLSASEADGFFLLPEENSSIQTTTIQVDSSLPHGGLFRVVVDENGDIVSGYRVLISPAEFGGYAAVDKYASGTPTLLDDDLVLNAPASTPITIKVETVDSDVTFSFYNGETLLDSYTDSTSPILESGHRGIYTVLETGTPGIVEVSFDDYVESPDITFLNAGWSAHNGAPFPTVPSAYVRDRVSHTGQNIALVVMCQFEHPEQGYDEPASISWPTTEIPVGSNPSQGNYDGFWWGPYNPSTSLLDEDGTPIEETAVNYLNGWKDYYGGEEQGLVDDGEVLFGWALNVGNTPNSTLAIGSSGGGSPNIDGVQSDAQAMFYLAYRNVTNIYNFQSVTPLSMWDEIQESPFRVQNTVLARPGDVVVSCLLVNTGEGFESAGSGGTPTGVAASPAYGETLRLHVLNDNDGEFNAGLLGADECILMAASDKVAAGDVDENGYVSVQVGWDITESDPDYPTAGPGIRFWTLVLSNYENPLSNLVITPKAGGADATVDYAGATPARLYHGTWSSSDQTTYGAPSPADIRNAALDDPYDWDGTIVDAGAQNISAEGEQQFEVDVGEGEGLFVTGTITSETDTDPLSEVVWEEWETTAAATGTGDLVSDDASIDGDGFSGSTGTGALVSNDASIAGAGASSSTGTGALTSPDAEIDGAGGSSSTGTGALQAQDAEISGVGNAQDPLEAVTGTGALTASDAALAGTGTGGSSGTGDPASDDAAIDGTGTAAHTGTGALLSGEASIEGVGVSGSTGEGDLESRPATINGFETEPEPSPYKSLRTPVANLDNIRKQRLVRRP